MSTIEHLKSLRCLIALAAIASPGLAAAEGVDQTPPAPSNVYIPTHAKLVNLNTSGNVVFCVIGYSQANNSLAVNGTAVPVPAYILTNEGGLAWQSTIGTASGTISALTAQAGVTKIPLSPPGGGYINSGTLTIFAVKSPPANFSCATSISYSFTSTGGLGSQSFTVTTPVYPYPKGLFEISTYPVSTGSSTYDSYATIDLSNVDTFELPMAVNVHAGASSPRTKVGSFGNPVASPLVTGSSIITGGTGGAASPFYTWVQAQPQSSTVAASFLPLALATPTYPYAMIQSPNDYLNEKCTLDPVTGVYYPQSSNCSAATANGFVNLADPLNSYFDAELTRFFNNAVDRRIAKKLVVMGDGYDATHLSVPWTAEKIAAPCDLYLLRAGRALKFTSPAYPRKEVLLCNPVGQVEQLNGAPAISNSDKQWGNRFVEIKLANAQQCEAARKHFLWNFGQPDSGFVGRILSRECTAERKIRLQVVEPPPAGAKARLTQAYCTKEGACNRPNASFTTWVFSNIAWAPNIKWAETASQMTFANDGAFADFQSTAYANDGDFQKIAKSIARNIVTAFNRGIANCNTVTMSDQKLTPAYCANVSALTTSTTPALQSNAVNASDAWWSNPANFYPAGGYQNYYSQYLHTMRLPSTPTPLSIFTPPVAPPVPSYGRSNQGVPMGMAYGFAYDENPGYVSGELTVPSKFDPMPATWWANGATVDVHILIGK